VVTYNSINSIKFKQQPSTQYFSEMTVFSPINHKQIESKLQLLSTFVLSGNTNHGDDNQNCSNTSANNEDDLRTDICRTDTLTVDCSP